MRCKFCHKELGEDFKVCPYCAAKIDDAEQIPEQAPPEAKNKVWLTVLAAVGGVAVMVVLGALLLTAFGVNLIPGMNRPASGGESTAATTEATTEPTGGIYTKDKYTGEELNADAVVATAGQKELTNGLLQIFYMAAVNSFAEEYAAYMDYFELDLESDLGDQVCSVDDSMTWEQFFIDEALNEWYSYQLMCMVAEDAGYTASEEWVESLQKMPEDIQANAKEEGYDSALAMLQYIYGKNCTVETYLDFADIHYNANTYYASVFDVTEEDIEEYFTENQQTLAEKDVVKDDDKVGTVRHILIAPEGGTTDEFGQTTYTEEQLQEAYERAQKILDEWRSGEATEESFAALVSTYSADTGSTSTGGLYEYVAADGSYVEEFQNWAVDPNRKEGDVEIVQTSFGYHIMYYVSGVDEWHYYAESGLLQQLYNEVQEAIDAKNEEAPLEVEYEKIILG